jgi:hypothetical protein
MAVTTVAVTDLALRVFDTCHKSQNSACILIGLALTRSTTVLSIVSKLCAKAVV